MPSIQEQLAIARERAQKQQQTTTPSQISVQERVPLGNLTPFNQSTPSRLFRDDPLPDEEFGLGSSGLIPTLNHAMLSPDLGPSRESQFWAGASANGSGAHSSSFSFSMPTDLSNAATYNLGPQDQRRSLMGSQVLNMDLSPTFVAHLRALANDFTPDLNEALDQYIQTSTLAERLAAHFMSNLQTRSMIQQLIQDKDTHWEVSASLKKLLVKYAKAYMLSSTAKFYIKCNPEDIIVAALRANRVKDLPGENDLTANDTLKSAASRAIVQFRSTVKDHIVLTVRNTSKSKQLPADERDLSTVAQSLLGGLKDVPLSLALMYRLAVMRNVVDNNLNLSARDFWPMVDSEMANLLGIGQDLPKSQQDIISDFQLIYEFDVEKYGKPQVTPTNIGSANYQWKPYIKALNTLAGNASVIESAEKRAEKKRKRRVNDVGGQRTRKSADANAGSEEDGSEKEDNPEPGISPNESEDHDEVEDRDNVQS